MRGEKKTIVYVGTSGWSYWRWRGKFYPENTHPGDMLPFYVRHFSTVEVNSSFYRMPREELVRRWSEVSPSGFLFSLKAPRTITHELRLRGVEEELRRFFGVIKQLGEKVGVVLYQFPPSLHYDRRLLEGFFKKISSFKIYRQAVEFRHPSWHRDESFALLRDYEIGYCILSSPRLPTLLRVSAEFAYLRFHGVDRYYRYNYSEEELKEWSEKISKVGEIAREVFVYFNNDWQAYAVANARTLIHLLRERGLNCPFL